MAEYAVIGDVEGRLAGLMQAINPPTGTFTATTSPNVTRVGEFLDDAELELDATLIAVGITPPGAAGSVRQKAILGNIILYFALGLIINDYNQTAGRVDDTSGMNYLQMFKDALMDIRKNSSYWTALLAGAANENTKVLSHVTNGTKGASIQNGDFDPVFGLDYEI